MGFCPELTVFKKIINWAITKLIKIKKNKRRSRIFIKEEIVIISWTSKKITVKLINEKKYWATKVNLKGLNLEET